MTAIHWLDTALQILGALYVFLSIVANVLPKEWPFTVFLAKVVADLKRIVPHDTAKKLGESTAPILVLAFVGLAASGCAMSLGEAKRAGPQPPVNTMAAPILSDHCDSLDAQQRTWGAIAKGAAVLAGGSGIGSIPVKNDDTARVILVSSGVGLAAVAAISVFVQESAASSWARDCSNAGSTR